MNPLDNTLPVRVLTIDGSARLRLTIRSRGGTSSSLGEATAVLQRVVSAFPTKGGDGAAKLSSRGCGTGDKERAKPRPHCGPRGSRAFSMRGVGIVCYRKVVSNGYDKDEVIVRRVAGIVRSVSVTCHWVIAVSSKTLTLTKLHLRRSPSLPPQSHS